MPWPSVAEVHSYRKKVYETVSNVIQSLTDEQCENINQSSPLWALVMAFEHERIHLETSSFLISELPIKFVKKPIHFPLYHPAVNTAKTTKIEGTFTPTKTIDYPQNEMVSVNRSTVTVGKSRDFGSFGWDNEYGQREFSVPAFQASKYKISNGYYYYYYY